MKVCDLVQFHSELSGGVKRYVEDKMRSFGERPEIRHAVIVPGRRSTCRRRYGSAWFEVASPPLIGSRSYRLMVARRRILAILEREQPDIIEVDDPYYLAWIAVEGGRRLNAPVVAFYHSDYPRALGRTMRKLAGPAAERWIARPIERYLRAIYGRMDAVVVASAALHDVLAAMGIARLRHIPLGVNTAVFTPTASRPQVDRELGLKPETMLLLFVGRLAREKHTRALLAMMDRLRADAAPYHLAIIGDGELRRVVERAAHDQPDISWLGYSDDNRRLSALYAAADLLVHPGTLETFGLVSIEAQACGTRVLVVRGGGMEHTVRPADAALTAASPDPADLAAAVRTARRQGDSPAARCERRAFVAARFSTETMCERLIALYAALRQQRDTGGNHER